MHQDGNTEENKAGNGRVELEWENEAALWIGKNAKERHGLLKVQLTPLNWNPSKLTREHDQTMKRYSGKDLWLLNQFWKHNMSSRTHNDRPMATRDSCEQESSPGVAIYPDGGWGSPNICWGLTKRISYPAKKWMETQVVVYWRDMYSCSIPWKSEHLPDTG